MPKMQNGTLTFGNTTLNCKTQELRCTENHIKLTDRQFAITRMLFQTGADNLLQSTILDEVWGADSWATDKDVVAQVRTLRQKLGRIGSNIAIKSIKHQGYHLEVEGP